MFYGGGLAELGWVVLDECHYMGDEGRGTVWEEIIVNAPANVRLVALSATVANVKEIADWISIVHRPIVPIYHPHRPVPLSYAVADLAGEIHEFDKVRTGRARVIGDERHGPDQRGRWYSRRVVDPVVLIEAMEGRGWLPAIYFIFSRVGCERALEDVLTEGRALLTSEQPPAANPALRSELLAMRDADQELRRRALKDPKSMTIVADLYSVEERAKNREAAFARYFSGPLQRWRVKPTVFMPALPALFEQSQLDRLLVGLSDGEGTYIGMGYLEFSEEEGVLRLLSPVEGGPKALKLGSVRLEDGFKVRRVDLRNLFGTD